VGGEAEGTFSERLAHPATTLPEYEIANYLINYTFKSPLLPHNHKDPGKTRNKSYLNFIIKPTRN